jgi:membrane fusion protein (multidrug efflux system)
VRYTTAVQQEIRESVRLPGTVETRRGGVVASEVPGVVVDIEVEPGDRVREGQVLARLRQTNTKLQLEAARGRLTEAKARLKLAESNLVRAQDLFDDQVVSQGELDDAYSESAAWQGRVDATTAEIDRLEEDLERSVIRAPYGGAIVQKLTEVGQWVATGGPVMEMVSLKSLEIRVDLPERYFDLLKLGARADVTFEALPGVEMTGEVRGIIPRAEARARSFPVRVRIDNRDGRVGVGMLASVGLPIGEATAAVLVPKDSLVRQGDRQMLFRLKDDDTVEPLPVETGRGVGSWIVVAGAVAAGDRVVTRGNERLRPGQSVLGEELEYPAP